MKKLLVVMLLCVGGCGFLQSAVPAVIDAAAVLCEAFATEHPQEFTKFASDTVGLDKSSLSAEDLCKIPEIVRPFVTAAQSSQESARASLQK